jgi:hypothetical protein
MRSETEKEEEEEEEREDQYRMRTSEKDPNCDNIPATEPPGTYSRTI